MTLTLWSCVKQRLPLVADLMLTLYTKCATRCMGLWIPQSSFFIALHGGIGGVASKVRNWQLKQYFEWLFKSEVE